MEYPPNIRIIKVIDNKIHFYIDSVTIIVEQFSYFGDKHKIANPSTAIAHFVCQGEKYSVDNTGEFSTVEDWYSNELLPKIQMLSLLKSDIVL